MDSDMDVDDNELSFFAGTFQQLTSAPPSTPNSSASSPPVGMSNNDDMILAPQGFLHSMLHQYDCGDSALIPDSKIPNSKRGPGRPRKDIPMMFRGNVGSGGVVNKGPQKRKVAGTKDGERTGASGVGVPFSMAPSSSDSSNIGFPDEKPSMLLAAATPADDSPYFLEKYLGKVCCLCNLGERSALGQGDFLRFETSGSVIDLDEKLFDDSNHDDATNFDDVTGEVGALSETSKASGPGAGITMQYNACRRLKNAIKCKLPANMNECVNELDKVGQAEPLALRALLDGIFLYVHRMCAMWSLGPNNGSCHHSVVEDSIIASNIELVASKCLKRKCSYCGQYGASISCKMSCPKTFHLPCAAAVGCFLIIESFTAFCGDHLNQVPLICTSDSNIDCRQCFALGDITKLVMCSTCGDHYHTNCVGLVNLPDTKAGWNCSQCSKCQICRQSDSTEGRSIKCEQCQKLYHATCLRPIISSIPKYGWKCNRCRVCTDCGSRTPGAGTSSRWHCHYTICDSCYQQRNKGFSCPICHKAYRAAAHKEMVKCSWCNRFVHSSCDGEADLSVYHKHKENNPDYDYVCPYCKAASNNEKTQANSANQMRFSIDSSDMTPLAGIPFGDILCKNSEFEYFEKGICIDNSSSVGDGKPFDAYRMSKKRLNFKDFQQRSRGGKVVLQKTIPGALTPFGRKRSTRGKNRHMMLLGGVSGAHANIVGGGAVTERSLSSRNTEDEVAIEKKLVLCSAKDKFILSQDICVMCGSIGNDQESCLIACAQCGQCYHPYCVNIKVSKVILQKGWRCLDCTVCEGCGQKNDEARLILCDECDISYHTYCMSPPLDTVPHGNWKCKWCAVCQKCGRTSPGKNASWRNSYLECGPCSSQVQCCVCLHAYVDNELIIQCRNCERWLHCKCDAITNEEQAQLADNIEYHCVLCRPKEKSFSSFLAEKMQCKNWTSPKIQSNANASSSLLTEVHNKHSIKSIGAASGGTGDLSATSAHTLGNSGGEPNEYIEATHWVDGVCVSERGFNVIKSLTTEIKKKRKMRPTNDGNTKDSGILAAIESVVANASSSKEGGGGSTVDGKQIAQPMKKAGENYKDGMVWVGGVDPPEGFSISTNDEGINILRKKRQRNLQKLGIGGFNVRNRTFKKVGEENADASNNIQHETEKKKKIIRKKLKTKLTETYPIYLQEAFFGKTLLDTNETSFSLCESESSDECENNSVSLLGQFKNTSSSEEKPITHQLNKQTGQEQYKKSSAVKIKMEIDTSPPLLIDTKSNVLLSTLSSPKEESCTVTNVAQRSEVVSNQIGAGPKEVIAVAHGTQKAVMTSTLSTAKISDTNEDFADTSITSENVTDSVSNVSLIDHMSGIPAELDLKPLSDDLCSNSFGIHLNRKKAELSIPMPTSSGTIKPQLTENPVRQNGMSYNKMPTTHPQQPLQMENVAERLQNQKAAPHSSSMPDKSLNIMQLNQLQHSQQEQFIQQQPQVSNENPMKVYLTPTLSEEPIEATAAGTQKTAEKMRRDEDLGSMATISAVLYANALHPELKQIYPNWNDRCKQILKRWRSLSTDKKAPFLQNAKDNRSSLRMRRAQQDQEKICFQQKTLKEQEQERIWKQHQAKAKEAHTNIFSNDGNAFDPNFGSADGCSTDDKRPLLYTTNLVSESGQHTFPSNNVIGSVYDPNIKTPIQRQPNTLVKSNSLLEKNDSSQVGDSGNKQLRTLLLKQTPSWLTDNNTSTSSFQSTLFQQSDTTFKLNTQEEPQKVNPLLCNVVKRNIPATKNGTISNGLQVMQQEQIASPLNVIKNDLKGRYDNKSVDNTDTAVVTAELDKLDQDENAGFGDILGGLGEGDDDDLLKSLTAEMGDDFNILEYADPELDELATNQNLLNKLDFDDNDKNN